MRLLASALVLLLAGCSGDASAAPQAQANTTTALTVADVATFGGTITAKLADPLTAAETPITLLRSGNQWEGGGLTLTASNTQTATTRTLQYHLVNRGPRIAVELTVNLLTITPTSDATAYLPTYGGQQVAIPATSPGFMHSSAWPRAAFSPVVSVYDANGNGWAIDYWDPSLTPVDLRFYGSIADHYLNPVVCHLLDLYPGQSQSFTVRYTQLGGLPDAALAQHRAQHLVPFMNALGIPESPSLGLKSPLAASVTGAPGIQARFDDAVARGFTGMVQWAAPDGRGYFQPYAPTDQAWWREIERGLRLNGHPLGILVDLNRSPRLAGGMSADAPDAVLPLNMEDPQGWSYQRRYAQRVGKAGVTLAFWDTGAVPVMGWTGLRTLYTLQLWKQAGVSIFCEAGDGDVGTWITGVDGCFFGTDDFGTSLPTQTNRARAIVCPQAQTIWFSQQSGRLTPARAQQLEANGYIIVADPATAARWRRN